MGIAKDRYKGKDQSKGIGMEKGGSMVIDLNNYIYIVFNFLIYLF